MRGAGWKLWVALGVVYVVWGSTYFAIKIAVGTLPPVLTAGTRFLAAGLLLALLLAASRRRLRTTRNEAATAAGLGVLMLGLGVGAVHIAETRIDSSIAAMIAGTVPLQIVVMRSLTRDRPSRATTAAVLGGLMGLALVILPEGQESGSTALGLAIMLAATIAWSSGSFVSSRLTLPADPFVTTTIQMLSAGAVLFAVGLAAGEWEELDTGSLAAGPLTAWAYLVLAGSLLGFSAYVWLLRRAPISLVVTHQYVNPIVAIALGALVLDERFSTATAVGAAVIITSVFATVRIESRARRQAPRGEPAVDSSP
jgi:drug/metabolite transporter (DMT)-like permease